MSTKLAWGLCIWTKRDICAVEGIQNRVTERLPFGNFVRNLSRVCGTGIERSRPKLYFVKVDVQACFDTIEQSTLLKILKELMSKVSHRAA